MSRSPSQLGHSAESNPVPPRENRRSVYGTEYDAWVVILLVATLLVVLGFLIYALLRGNILIAALFGLFLFIVVGLTIPINYTITATELVVRSGLIVRRIPLEGIERIYPDRTVLANPAGSFDRLAIKYRRADRSRMTLWISPRHRQRFLEEIARSAGLTLVDGECVRESGA